LETFHNQNPLAPGQNVAQLRLQIGLDGVAFEKIVGSLIRKKQIAKDGNVLRLTSHHIQFSGEVEAVKKKIEKVFLDAKLNTPSLGELTAQLSEYPSQSIEETFYALLNLGRFIKISDGLFIHAETFDNLSKLLTNYLGENGIITVAEFRELAQTSRKYAVPFLEYCDAQGITIREDNHRRLRKSAQRES
jgi:selenocysteine-specific elongation factor